MKFAFKALAALEALVLWAAPSLASASVQPDKVILSRNAQLTVSRCTT